MRKRTLKYLRRFIISQLGPQKGSILWYANLPNDHPEVVKRTVHVTGNKTIWDFDAFKAIMGDKP